MSANLERENEVFSNMVTKAASGCLGVIEKDFKLSRLLIPTAGHTMFVLFVVLRLVTTLMKLLESKGEYDGLLQIYKQELRKILDNK